VITDAIVNKNGDRTPPWRTPQVIEKYSEKMLSHLTTAPHLLYQLMIAFSNIKEIFRFISVK